VRAASSILGAAAAKPLPLPVMLPQPIRYASLRPTTRGSHSLRQSRPTRLTSIGAWHRVIGRVFSKALARSVYNDVLMLLPSCIRSKPLLMSGNGEGAASRTLRLPVAGLDGCALLRRRASLQPDCNWLTVDAQRRWAAGPLPGRTRRFFSRHHLRQSVSCLSSIENTAPSLTSTFRTMQTRPILSASFTS
jgi:hypothetical protein